MSNPLYNAMGGGAPNLPQMLQQLKANPMQLLGRRFNLPSGITPDPNAILQHLMRTGQVTQQQLNAIYQQAERLGLRR